jgi:hypothetical protein
MSLAFLAKKTWHVTNFQNQEAVWKAEQAQAEEQRKLEEWKTKREEERQIMELRQLQRESGQGGGEGASKQQERVDFLYDVPATRKEEYLLGKPVEIAPEESDVKKVEHLPGSNFLAVGQNNLSSAANEEFNKMSNDPLVAMRLEEQKALQRIMNNPIKLKQIRGAVEERKQALMGGHDGGSERHKHGKRDKDRHHHHHKSSGSSTHRSGSHHHKSSKHDKHDRHDKHHKSSKHDKHSRKRSRHHSSGSGSGSDSDDAPRGAPPPPSEREREHHGDGPRGDGGGGGGGGGEQPTVAKKAGFGLQFYAGGAKLGSGGGDTSAPAASDFEASASFAGVRPGMVFRSGPQGLGYYRDQAAQASAPGGSARGGAPGGGVPAHGASRAAGTSGGGGSGGGGGGGGGSQPQHQRQRERRGPLSAAEKEERLRQMMNDADQHDGERRKRSKSDDARAAAEREALQAEALKASADGDDAGGPAFVRDMARRMNSESSVAEQINQQKHYLQRGKSGDAASFTGR